VGEDVLARLVLAFGVAGVLLAALSAFWLMRFPISREEHEARLERLAHTRAKGGANPLDEAARADPEGHSVGA
jgi:GPH family glycoside/pentoside/hexuronide:cation symporter